MTWKPRKRTCRTHEKCLYKYHLTWAFVKVQRCCLCQVSYLAWFHWARAKMSWKTKTKTHPKHQQTNLTSNLSSFRAWRKRGNIFEVFSHSNSDRKRLEWSRKACKANVNREAWLRTLNWGNSLVLPPCSTKELGQPRSILRNGYPHNKSLPPVLLKFCLKQFPISPIFWLLLLWVSVSVYFLLYLVTSRARS